MRVGLFLSNPQEGFSLTLLCVQFIIENKISRHKPLSMNIHSAVNTPVDNSRTETPHNHVSSHNKHSMPQNRQHVQPSVNRHFPCFSPHTITFINTDLTRLFSPNKTLQRNSRILKHINYNIVYQRFTQRTFTLKT